jgi:hypothetical protein
VPLPDEVRGIYWTANTAGSELRRQELTAYIKNNELNTVVIDLKTDNGALAYEPFNTNLEQYTTENPLIYNLPEILEELGHDGIYRIARVAVMRDDMFALKNPHLALKTADGSLWRDSIGSNWLDPTAPEVVQYAIAVGHEARKLGFDEVQYDYVRFPSDGRLGSIVYPVYDERDSKILKMEEFFKTLSGGVKGRGIKISFDLFGMTFVNNDDFGIGQRLLEAYPYADFISPMVYPSHYASGFRGHANPALHPYDVVHGSLESGATVLKDELGILPNQSRLKFRPWLQDFDLGAVYTSKMIEDQIDAARDAGASGWLLWNARNVYEPADYGL